jgi:hypothetical protein
VVRRSLWVLALMAAACGRRSSPQEVPVPPAPRSAASALASCIQSIDSADGTGPCDCLHLVHAEDGIDENEARVIARSYYQSQQLAEFGGAGPPVRYGEDWLSMAVGFRTDLDGRKGAPHLIRISARTGATSLPGRACFATVDDSALTV